MDIAKSLEELKTALVGGYDKAAVHDLLEKVIVECQEDSQKEITELKAKNSRLEADVQGYQKRNELLTGQFEALSESMKKMTTAMEKETDYTQRRDKELEAFYRKEEELNNRLGQVREEAEKEKAQILEEAQQERTKLLQQARSECDEILKYAETEKETLLCSAKEEQSQLLERSVRIRKNLEEWKEKMQELFAWSDTVLESSPDPVEELLTSLEVQQQETIREEDTMDSGMMIGTDES